MGKYILLITLFLAATSFAATKKSPYRTDIDARFNAIESLTDAQGLEVTSGNIIVGDSSGNGNQVTMSGDALMSNAGVISLSAQTADGDLVKRVVRANLDCGVSDCSAGTVSMVQTLPAKAIIYQAYWYTETQFVDGGSGTVAFHCEDANNIFTAADITGNAAGAIIAGNATGVIATMVASIAAECTITATIATAEQTAGVLTLFVEYLVHD